MQMINQNPDSNTNASHMNITDHALGRLLVILLGLFKVRFVVLSGNRPSIFVLQEVPAELSFLQNHS